MSAHQLCAAKQRLYSHEMAVTDRKEVPLLCTDKEGMYADAVS